MLNKSKNKYSNFATKKWYVTNNETKGAYLHHDPVTFLTKSVESSLCNYSDAYVLVVGDITVIGGNENTKVAFKNYSPFNKCRTEIYVFFVDEADFINIAIPMYNLIEYSDNNSDSSGSLWQLKRDKTASNVNVCNANSSSFEYKSSLIGNLVVDGANGKKEKVKIAVPLKYLSDF